MYMKLKINFSKCGALPKLNIFNLYHKDFTNEDERKHVIMTALIKKP